MMNRKQTVGILAHVDAGKTTLSEAMLYLSGRLRKAGRVDHKDTFLDTNAIERDRGITIFSKQARLSFEGTDITLLDTPGHVDFCAETERTLQVQDCAVLVISGTDGVQSHTRTLFRLLAHYGVPAFVFVNKMDLPGADKYSVMRGLRKELGGNFVDFAGEGDAFTEELAMCSDQLLEEFSAEGELRPSSVRDAIFRRELFPVFFGSALKMEGVRPLLSALAAYTSPKWEQAAAGPFGARVYKIGRDALGTRLTFLRVTSGELAVKDMAGDEKADQIRLYSGDKYELTERVQAGDICAVTGLSESMPGMGLGCEKQAARPVLEAVMTRALILPPDVSAPSFFRKIRVLEEEDPALRLLWDEKAQEIHAQIMGQVQLEVLTRIIKERFGASVSFGPERILYKETILAPVIGIGHFEPLRHYAEVQLLIEPGERGSGITVASVCSEDVLALNWQRLILTHVLEREHPGVLTGAPVTDLKITLLTGRAHLKHTEGGDFRQATYRAIRQGLKSAQSVLLEPWYHFTLDIPAECLGRAMSDLSRMHASFGDPVTDGDRAALEGRVPVSAVGSYVTDVHAYTSGAGSLTLVPDGYDLCLNADDLLADNTYDSEADPENPTGSVFCVHGAGYLVPWNEVPDFAHCEIPRSALAKVQDILASCGLLPSAEDGLTGDDVENDWGRAAKGTAGEGPGSPGGRSAAKTAAGSASPEEDAEFLAIYAREFGLDKNGVRMDQEKRNRAHNAAYGRKKSSGEKYPEVHQKYDRRGNPIYPKKDTRPDYMIVDGYNIIFQWKELRELAADNIDAARGKLLDILSNYQGFTGTKMTVVFDAWRTSNSPASVSHWQNVEVVFTQKEETADAYIERSVHELAGKYKITVATSDGLEQLTVLRLGALRMSARMLEEDIERVCGEWKR